MRSKYLIYLETYPPSLRSLFLRAPFSGFRKNLFSVVIILLLLRFFSLVYRLPLIYFSFQTYRTPFHLKSRRRIQASQTFCKISVRYIIKDRYRYSAANWKWEENGTRYILPGYLCYIILDRERYCPSRLWLLHNQAIINTLDQPNDDTMMWKTFATKPVSMFDFSSQQFIFKPPLFNQ